MTNEHAYNVARVAWASAGEALRAIRRQVFVHEQGVPETLEWDGLDPGCIHVLARDARGMPIGTGRLLPDGRIGRMAVLPSWRRGGVGSALLAELVAIARTRGDRAVILHAQSYVLDFYRKAGFEVMSPEFMEAGIPHREMRLSFE